MGHVFLRLARAGVAAAILVGLGGWILERVRFGSTDDTTRTRVEAELRQRFDAIAAALSDLALKTATLSDIPRAATAHDSASTVQLFDEMSAAIPETDRGRTGVTVYDADGLAVAWSGRASELSKDRLAAAPGFFIAMGAPGPRLVRVEPVASKERPAAGRVATVVVERSLGESRGAPGLDNAFFVQTALAEVTLRPSSSRRAPAPPSASLFTIDIPSTGGGLTVEAEVDASELVAARSEWRGGTLAAVMSVIGVTLLSFAAPLIERRRRTRRAGSFLLMTIVLAAMLVTARLVFWFAITPILGARDPSAPLDLLLTALIAAGLVWLLLDLLERRRVTSPRPRIVSPDGARGLVLVIVYLVAGGMGASIMWTYGGALRVLLSRTTLDVLHFSLHPLNAGRLAVAFALLLFHTCVLWLVAGTLRVPTLIRRSSRTFVRSMGWPAWAAGVAGVSVLLNRLGPPVPALPLAAALAAAGMCGLAFTLLRDRSRRASQAARMLAFFLAVAVPALAMYPMLLALSAEAKDRLIVGEYRSQVESQRNDLKDRLQLALDQIDGLTTLKEFVADSQNSETPSSDGAYLVWSRTALAAFRLTSAIELYDDAGQLVSRFALNLQEYTSSRHRAEGCDWALYEEPPLRSSERHVLRASRGICEGGRMLGSIVVRAMLDLQTLPFVSSQSPYLQALRTDLQPATESAFGRDIDLAVYGWSRAPFHASSPNVWPLPDAVFQRMVGSRDSVWTTVAREGEVFRVCFFNDRSGIYALGYAVTTPFGHLINLAELFVLAGVLYLAVVAGATAFAALTSRTPASGRVLLREMRSSFYRKLWLAFVAGAVFPVVILALLTSSYFTTQLRAGEEDSAAKAATVAQRLVEDYVALQPRGVAELSTIDDPIMVLVSRAIDHDVNLFNRTHLQATSALDLFASGMLTTRTPSDAYEQILLRRLPTFVGLQSVGESQYLLAAAPVRAGDREGIVTVPLPLRQQAIEHQIDEFDRQLLFGAVLFSLLGAGLGYWMAERIADPVSRLTRATRRIARGDLDARIAATSSDELRRLVEDFNQMAADLKRQRTELERTQRLEAWADMARQVAHDIKNPLTPIQLSAEHARRINFDQGRPLSPVLDECVDAILTQVKLLRQISSEFSSFASSPTARPERTSLPALLQEVVAPYRTALTGRVTIVVDTETGLPLVNIDRTLFSRALTNVIENALHAMPGGGRLTIAGRLSNGDGGADGAGSSPPADRPSARAGDGATTSAPDSRVVVEVTDTGVGMDAEAVARMFEPYFSTKTTGTGLGLTIAKRNVELNGGTIRVASRRGVGTTVTIALPAAA